MNEVCVALTINVITLFLNFMCLFKNMLHSNEKIYLLFLREVVFCGCLEENMLDLFD